MSTYAWVLIFNFTMNGGWTVIDNIASQASCEALKSEIDAPKAKCVRYETAHQIPGQTAN